MVTVGFLNQFKIQSYKTITLNTWLSFDAVRKFFDKQCGKYPSLLSMYLQLHITNFKLQSWKRQSGPPTLSFCENRTGTQLTSLETKLQKNKERKKGNWLLSSGVFFHMQHRQLQKNTPSAATLVIHLKFLHYVLRSKGSLQGKMCILGQCSVSCAFSFLCWAISNYVVTISSLARGFFSLTVDVSVDIKRSVFFGLAEIRP